MKDYSIKQKVISDRGITLVALIITIVVLFIIAGISVNVGTEVLSETRKKGFYTELEIIQKRVDDIAATNESYVDTNGNIKYLKESGTSYLNLTSAKQTILTNILQSEGSGLGLSASNFRYFTVQDLEEKLNLSEMRYNVFVDFNSRTIIAEEGINIDGQEYHILKNNIYFSNGSNTNKQNVASLEYTVTNYGANAYKITVIPKNYDGQTKMGGTLRYKPSYSQYWKISDRFDIIVSEATTYEIEYEDENKNKIKEIITVSGNS